MKLIHYRLGLIKWYLEIKLLIEKIKEKAVIEKKLNEQEMKNLLLKICLRKRN